MPKVCTTDDPAQVTISVSICPILLARLDAIAKAESRSRSWMINTFIKNGLKSRKA